MLNTQKQAFRLILDSTQAVILVTLTWNTDNTDLDLYTIDPTGDYSSYNHRTTADGGVLDNDNTYGFGPEHWTLSGVNTVRWGEDYKLRVHYYSDYQACTTCDPVVPVRPTGWTVSLMLYEGTTRMETITYHGVLTDADGSSNDAPDGTGASWADVVTITPVQAPSPTAVPSVRKTNSGEIRITVPISSEADRLKIKSASRANNR